MPPSSFASQEEEAPNQSSQASDNPTNPAPQPIQEATPRTGAQERFEANRQIPTTPSATRSKSHNFPSNNSSSSSRTT